jgi:hypothetical protein
MDAARDVSSSVAVERAKKTVWQLHRLGFRASLDNGALRIADVTGNGRDLSRYLQVVEVFETIVAGLAENLRLLDSMTEEGRR